MKAIDAENHQLFELLCKLKEQAYFRLYSADMLGSCEYLPQELKECYSETCEIYPVDEDKVPANIKEVDNEEHDFEIDGWGRWDMPTDDYYDTKDFPEEYTGYDGGEVWTFIHDRTIATCRECNQPMTCEACECWFTDASCTEMRDFDNE